MSQDLWSSYSARTCQVNLSESESSLSSVGDAVADQCQIVTELAQSWAEIDSATTVHRQDTAAPSSSTSYVSEPGRIHASPERFPLVPLEAVARQPAEFGFVEVYEDAVVAHRSSSSHNGHPRSRIGGLRYARKDMIFREAKLCECGSSLLSGFTPKSTASILQRLDQEGAEEVGRLHMAELALSPTGRNEWLGPGKNPWDVTRVSGGSSSGSGISVATRAVDFSLGTDTGGSVRLPAAACGVTGLKPTNGLLPLDGVLPLSPTLDCLGILAPTARTIAAVFERLIATNADALLKPEAGPPTVRFATLDDTDPVDPPMRDAALRLKSILLKLGYAIDDCPAPELDSMGKIASLIMSAEAASVWIDELRSEPRRFHLEIRRRIERGTLVPAPIYLKARRARCALLNSFLTRYIPPATILVIPTTPGEAPTIASSLDGTPETLETRFHNYSYWTRGINYLGLPAISIPIGFGPNGLPLGMQLIGRPFADRAVLRAAIAIQDATAWHLKLPPCLTRGLYG